MTNKSLDSGLIASYEPEFVLTVGLTASWCCWAAVAGGGGGGPVRLVQI